MNVKSHWASKINWTQIVAFAAMVLTVFGVDLPTEVQVQIVSAIVAVQSIVTWIFRTFFTTKLVSASI